LFDRTSGDVVLFTAGDAGDNARAEKHSRRGGIVACLHRGQFVIRRGRVQIPIAAERDVPLMLGGAARFQRQNVLAAIASAYVRGMPYDDIRAGLTTFFPSPALTPGRLNVTTLRSGARVIIDYAHNAPAIEGVVDFVGQLSAARRTAIVAAPGDRRDDDIRAVGARCARFDHVIIKEDGDRRGRDPGAVAALLREGLEGAGMNPSAIEVVHDEVTAIRHGIAQLAEDDVLVVFADDIAASLRAVEPFVGAGA